MTVQVSVAADAHRPRYRYADGQHGQIHLTELGEGEPLILLHWAPSNARQYAHVMPAFAARGFRVIGVDLPGYGRSHKQSTGWSCAQMAAEIAAALDDRGGLERSFIVGGHLSAAVAAELAIAAPERWPRMVLDGSPTFTVEQLRELMQAFAGLSPAWREDGAHARFAWDMTERFLREWNPDYRATPENFATQYAYMADYLQMGFAPIRAFLEPGSPAGGLSSYRAMERWPLIRSRVLALTAEREALRPAHAAAMRLLTNAREHEFPGIHPLMDPARTEEYVGTIAEFLRE